MGSAIAALLVLAANVVPPFSRMAWAKSTRSAHVSVDDWLPPDNLCTIPAVFDPPPDSAGAPALTASTAAFSWVRLPPRLRPSNAPSTYASHPVVPALTTALRPS